MRWPWSRQEAKDDPGTAGGRLDAVESQVRLLKGEWLDTLDRVERLVGRLTKRDQRAAVESEPAPPPQARPNGRPTSAAMADVEKRRAVRVPPGGADAVLRR